MLMSFRVFRGASSGPEFESRTTNKTNPHLHNKVPPTEISLLAKTIGGRDGC